ncbi:NAD(P)/FAD-dependent oxidoreductase [Gordonia sp. NPDC003424]
MTETSNGSVVIVGAGHGGAGLAAVLRQSGFAGSITLLGDEPHTPYHRPPLSKKFDSAAVEQPLRPREFYADNGIDLRLGVRVTEIDRDRCTVITDDSSEIAYDTLVLATGSSPIALPGVDPDCAGVLTLRTLDDATTLGRSLSRGGALAIVGGGYVGMEVAAVARSQGVEVTVVEREERILARVAGPELSSMLTAYHRERGTTIVTGRSVSGIRTVGTELTGVCLDDGQIIDCDTVLVGIGAIPTDGLAVAAGLTCDGGIITDEDGRTSDPHIFAIGDVARRPVAGHNGLRRLESIPAATEHATRVAAAIVGKQQGHHEVPWFWSDQYDLKLKIAGLGSPDDRVVTRRHPTGDAVSFFHFGPDGNVVAVEAVNANGDFMAGKKVIAAATVIDPEAVADPSIPLKEIISGARSLTHK